MNGYLLDTNVVSKFAPGRPILSPALSDWMIREGGADTLYLSAMTVAEIAKGVERLKRKGATAKARALEIWMNGIVSTFEDRILPMDLPVSMLVGQIGEAAIGKGHEPDLADVIIAATAKLHDLVLVTENVKHFSAFGIEFQLPVG